MTQKKAIENIYLYRYQRLKGESPLVIANLLLRWFTGAENKNIKYLHLLISFLFLFARLAHEGCQSENEFE